MNELEKMARNTDEVLFDKLTGMLPEGLGYLEKLVGKEFYKNEGQEGEQAGPESEGDDDEDDSDSDDSLEDL